MIRYRLNSSFSQLFVLYSYYIRSLFHDQRVTVNAIPEYGDIKGRLKPICIITQTYISDLKCKEKIIQM